MPSLPAVSSPPTQPSPSALINHTVSRSPVYNIGRAPFLLAQAIGVKQVHCTQPKVVLWARPGHVLANLQGLWEGRHSRDISLRCNHDHAHQLLESPAHCSGSSCWHTAASWKHCSSLCLMILCEARLALTPSASEKLGAHLFHSQRTGPHAHRSHVSLEALVGREAAAKKIMSAPLPFPAHGPTRALQPCLP